MPKRLSYGPTIFNVLLIMVFIVAIILALGYHDRAKVAPLVVSIPGLLVMLILLVKDLREKAKQDSSGDGESDQIKKEPATGAKDKKITTRSELIAFSWAALLFALLFILGFAVAIPLYLFLYMKVKSKETLKFSLAFAAVSSVVLYVFFMQILKMQLYEGLIFKMLS